MKPEDMQQDQLSSLLGRGELGQGHEVSYLTEAIYHCQDGGMFIGQRETGNKVQGDVRPGPMGHRQRLQKTCRSLVRWFMLVADRAGVDELPGVSLQSRPPESLQQDIPRTLAPGVAGESGVMGPLKDIRPQGLRDKQVIRRTGARTGLVLQGGLDSLLYLPGDRGNQDGGRKDSILARGGIPLVPKLAGQGVRLDVAGTGPVTERKVESGEKQTIWLAESSVSWRTECTPGSCGQSNTKRADWSPPASGATPRGPASQQAAPGYPHRSFFQQGRAA